jgi:hypothetical protein
MLSIFTIVLNGRPWIERHLPVFQKLKCDWRWAIVHGYAKPALDTSWCRDCGAPADDGTVAHLTKAAKDSRVHVSTRGLNGEMWDGKTEMVNHALRHLCATPWGGEGALMQIDADELWEPWQLERIEELMTAGNAMYDSAMFRCRYWVGPNRVAYGHDCHGNQTSYEWLRAWTWNGVDTFRTHEPPRLMHHGRAINPDVTANQLGLVFEHKAYGTRAQAEFKERYYGYRGLAAYWDELNAQTGPVLVPLGKFGNVAPFLTLPA